MTVPIVPATHADLAAIHDLLRANRGDHSLFQQPPAQLARHLPEFLVARDGDTVVGCLQVHRHPRGSVELLAVAVHPAHHGRGVGRSLMAAGIEVARTRTSGSIWLGTAKPGYFARFGFEPMSRWALPLIVLIGKLKRVAQQPLRRWIPALFGRHVFMRLAAEPAVYSS